MDKLYTKNTIDITSENLTKQYMKPRFLLKQGFMYNKVKSKPYKDICIFLVAHKLKWKGIEPEVHNPYIPISYFV